MSIWFVLAAMIFLHIIDDYVLQAPCLCDLKQKSFWEKNAPEKLYKYDYLCALFMHSLSWAFMIMLPIAIARGFNISGVFFGVFIGNAFIHAVVDDTKANARLINLWHDQLSHMLQIACTIFLYQVEII